MKIRSHVCISVYVFSVCVAFPYDILRYLIIGVVFQTPHLVNLNEDPLMSECLLYYIKDGITK